MSRTEHIFRTFFLAQKLLMHRISTCYILSRRRGVFAAVDVPMEVSG